MKRKKTWLYVCLTLLMLALTPAAVYGEEPDGDTADKTLAPYFFVQDAGPVSYTHLDVYKRQDGHHPVSVRLVHIGQDITTKICGVAPVPRQHRPCLLYTSATTSYVLPSIMRATAASSWMSETIDSIPSGKMCIRDRSGIVLHCRKSLRLTLSVDLRQLLPDRYYLSVIIF